MTDSNICVAELKSAYGIKGWLWLYSYTDPMTALFSYAPLFYKDGNIEKPVTIEKWRKQGKGIVVKLANVNDRNVADTLCNTKIYLHKENFPELSDDEFYWSDLVGLTVINNEQEVLGTLKQLFETSAHQIFEVIPNQQSIDDETRLIPWHDSTVVNVDLANKSIFVAWESDY